MILRVLLKFVSPKKSKDWIILVVLTQRLDFLCRAIATTGATTGRDYFGRAIATTGATTGRDYFSRAIATTGATTGRDYFLIVLLRYP